MGARSDPLYGPLLLIGAGGVLVELARDVALRLLPVTAPEVARHDRRAQARAAARRLSRARRRPIGPRSSAPRSALAQFYLDHRARIADVEINPLMIGPTQGRGRGRRAGAVARRTLKESRTWISSCPRNCACSRQSLRRFVNTELIPVERDTSRARTSSRSIARSSSPAPRTLGIWMMEVPEEYGGHGLSLLARAW